MVILVRKSTWSNFLDLVLSGRRFICYVIYAGPYMASSNHHVHGLSVFGLPSNILDSYKVSLIILSFYCHGPLGWIYLIAYVWGIVIVRISIKFG